MPDLFMTPAVFFDAVAAFFRALAPSPAKPRRAGKSWETLLDMGAR